MNKILTKVTALCVGLAMVAGVGVAVGSKAVAKLNTVYAAEDDTHEISDFTGKGVGVLLNNGGTPEAIEIADPGYAVKQVIIGWSHNKTNDGCTASVSVGGESLGSGKVGGSSGDHTTTIGDGNTSLTGAISITWTNGMTGTKKGTLYINSLTLVEGTGSVDPTLDTLNILLNDSLASPQTVRYSIGGLFYANDKDGNDIDAEWSSSNPDIFTVGENSNHVAYVTPVTPGTANIIATADGYNDGVFVLTIDAGAVETVTVSGVMTKTSYYVGETWSPAGLTVTADYEYGYHGDVTSEVAWSYDPAAPATNVTSVVATATLGSESGSSSAQAVTVSRTNPIQVLYNAEDSSTVDIYAVYVGFLTGSGPIVMDGAYGILCYSKTYDVSGFVAGETIVHVTGSMATYNGLRQVGSPALSVASGDFDAPETPVVYASKGGETFEYASRLTTVTGVPAVTKGSFDSDAGTADITMSFTVGSSTVQVFYKKAAQTADAEAFDAVKSAATNSTEVTVKGFTSWYNGFQVQMNGYVPAVEGYTAEDFSQDLLDQTDDICVNYEDGVSSYNEFKTLLEAVWSNLASNDKYPSLPSDQKNILAEAERDESGTVVEQAMARYDFLTGKYSLSNFINGRTPIVPAGSYVPSYENNLSSSSSITIIVIVAVASMTLLGVTLVIRKRKMN